MKTDGRDYYIKQKVWVHSNTFGGKSKDFWWKIDNSCSIYIIRYFLLRDKGLVQKRDEIRPYELEKFNQYVSFDMESALANDVAKLTLHLEKNGLGKYCYEVLEWSNTKSQLASQLSVIFSTSKAWQFNGQKKNMKFKKLSEDWCVLIKKYYNSVKEKDSETTIDSKINIIFFNKE